jgi:ferredoxin/flavodoxin---NADP+ reductase
MKITKKRILTDTQNTKIVEISVYAPHIAKKAKPGQFVVVMASEQGERIPLTFVDAKNDEITLIFQEAGLSTKLLGKLNEGDSLYAVLGPLGHETEIKNFGKVILVAGGVGIAEIYSVVKGLRQAGNHVDTIIGARSKDFLFLEKELREVSNKLHITTDDGSCERKGFTTDVLKELLSNDTYNIVHAVGPIPMMKKVAEVTKDFNIKTLVSLNSLMLDATGMCGGCRVTVGGEVKFACVDGPEFDGQLVDWDELEKRNKTYEQKEQHICRLYKS